MYKLSELLCGEHELRETEGVLMGFVVEVTICKIWKRWCSYLDTGGDFHESSLDYKQNEIYTINIDAKDGNVKFEDAMAQIFFGDIIESIFNKGGRRWQRYSHYYAI